VEADACGIGDTWLTRFRIDLVEALVLLGRLDDARAALDKFRQAAEESNRPWADAMVDHGTD